MRELIAMMQSEVPIAFLKLSLKKNIKTGTMINPPPAPIKPVIKPTNTPSMITIGRPNGLFANSSHFT